MIEVTNANESTNRQRELSQWFTPPWLAERMVRWSGAEDIAREREVHVLEPSAGEGVLIEHMPLNAVVTAVEIDPALALRLEARFTGENDARETLVLQGDFMTKDIPGDFDLAIANPPYEGGLDAAFVLRCTQLATRTVVLVRLAFLAGMKRRRDVWQHVDVTRIAILSERPNFGGDHGAKSDYVVLELTRRPARSEAPESITKIEWWTE